MFGSQIVECNYYQVLGLPETDDFKQIEDAFKRLNTIFHPDFVQCWAPEKLWAWCGELCEAVNNAYQTLKKADKRENHKKLLNAMLNNGDSNERLIRSLFFIKINLGIWKELVNQFNAYKEGKKTFQDLYIHDLNVTNNENQKNPDNMGVKKANWHGRRKRKLSTTRWPINSKIDTDYNFIYWEYDDGKVEVTIFEAEKYDKLNELSYDLRYQFGSFLKINRKDDTIMIEFPPGKEKTVNKTLWQIIMDDRDPQNKYHDNKRVTDKKHEFDYWQYNNNKILVSLVRKEGNLVKKVNKLADALHEKHQSICDICRRGVIIIICAFPNKQKTSNQTLWEIIIDGVDSDKPKQEDIAVSKRKAERERTGNTDSPFGEPSPTSKRAKIDAPEFPTPPPAVLKRTTKFVHSRFNESGLTTSSTFYTSVTPSPANEQEQPTAEDNEIEEIDLSPSFPSLEQSREQSSYYLPEPAFVAPPPVAPSRVAKFNYFRFNGTGLASSSTPYTSVTPFPANGQEPKTSNQKFWEVVMGGDPALERTTKFIRFHFNESGSNTSSTLHTSVAPIPSNGQEPITKDNEIKKTNVSSSFPFWEQSSHDSPRTDGHQANGNQFHRSQQSFLPNRDTESRDDIEAIMNGLTTYFSNPCP